MVEEPKKEEIEKKHNILVTPVGMAYPEKALSPLDCSLDSIVSKVEA